MSPTQQIPIEPTPHSNGAYLLRYWRDYVDSPNYRFMLKSIETGERVLFQDLADVLVHLQKKLEEIEK